MVKPSAGYRPLAYAPRKLSKQPGPSQGNPRGAKEVFPARPRKAASSRHYRHPRRPGLDRRRCPVVTIGTLAKCPRSFSIGSVLSRSRTAHRGRFPLSFHRPQCAGAFVPHNPPSVGSKKGAGHSVCPPARQLTPTATDAAVMRVAASMRSRLLPTTGGKGPAPLRAARGAPPARVIT
jgi:hypothetical protein